MPNLSVLRVAALKHAYLAACVALGEIPDTDHAAAVRGLLVVTRDRERREQQPETGLSRGLRLARSDQPAEGPTVLLVALVDDESQPKDFGSRSLARCCLVASGRVALVGGRPKARGRSANGVA